MQEPSTSFVKDTLDKAINDKEVLEFIKKTVSPFDTKSFKNMFDTYFASHPNISPADIINKAGLNRTYGYEVLNGTKKGSRDRIIALCFAAEMTVDELNHALTFSGHNQLYPKNTRDAYIEYFFRKKKGANINELNDALFENDVDELNI